jgi:hypothetical protein
MPITLGMLETHFENPRMFKPRLRDTALRNVYLVTSTSGMTPLPQVT